MDAVFKDVNLARSILIIGFLIVSFFSYAQVDEEEIDPMLIRFKAKIISAADSTPIPYANVINNRTHSGTITNNEGLFSLEMLNIDSLIITSVGYDKTVIKVPRNYSEFNTVTYVIKPINYAIGEVKVKGERTKVDLGLETGKPIDLDPKLRGDAYNEKPPILAALFNPASFMQYHLSKKEKRKREVREAMALEKNWEKHSRNYNKEKVKILTGLNETEADSFMLWFNSQNVLPYTSTEYEIRAAILEYFELYKAKKK